ncbi:hypothetical protein QQ045_022915 [Rhodiola kirilowii]
MAVQEREEVVKNEENGTEDDAVDDDVRFDVKKEFSENQGEHPIMLIMDVIVGQELSL